MTVHIRHISLLTLIMRMTVFALIMAMMKYSNGVDVTMLQMRYFIESLSSGMNNERGLAFSAKSIHCFCDKLSVSTSLHKRANLILVQIALGQLLFTLFLERDDDQRDEDVDEEEWEHNEEHHIE